MSTIYGTISTAPSPPRDSPFFPSDRQRCRSIGLRRSWKQMFVSFSIPESINAAIQRLPTNAAYFRANYVVVVLFALFLSLLWRPVSLIVLAVAIFAWMFIYFLRDAPIVLWGHAVDERLVLALMSVLTVVLLLLTRATVILVGLAVGVVMAAVHAVFRRTNDLDFDEEDGGGVGASVGLRETASASYSVL